jgi:carbonic anhydrase
MSYCTVINCIDGRVQLPVIAYLQNRYGVEYVDVVTEAGPVGVLSHRYESREAQSIFRRIEVSLQAHSSKGIAIVAHHDCAGNPIPDSEQKLQLQTCLELLSRRYRRLEIVGLWLDQNWAVHQCTI